MGAVHSKRPAASAKANGSRKEHAGASLDLLNKPHAAALQAISTPRAAVQAMRDAGATFAVHQRADTLGLSFTYRVNSDGDLDRCRAILAAVKSKPPAFFQAFQAELIEHRERSDG